MSKEQSCFPKLNDGNYIEWAMRMEAKLICRNFWMMVKVIVNEDGKDVTTIQSEWSVKKSKRSAQKMAEVRSEMILHVEDRQLSHMHAWDPMEIWEML